MVKRIGGFRRKTRSKMSKSPRTQGKISLRRYFFKFKDGDKVLLTAEPAIQTGMYFPRFYGKIGVVKGMQGECYKVGIKDGNKAKLVIVHPVHLRKI